MAEESIEETEQRLRERVLQGRKTRRAQASQSEFDPEWAKRPATDKAEYGLVTKCPFCGKAAQVLPRNFSILFWFLFIGPFALLLLLIPRTCLCTFCHTKFRLGGIRSM